MARPLTLAVPKGRVLTKLGPLLAALGVDPAALGEKDRRLIRETTALSVPLRVLLLKPDDVPTYVEYGAADLGVAGRDVLLERRYELYQPLDLGIGRCRLVVAGRAGDASEPDVPRVATKYARIATEHYAKKGLQADIVYVQGSVELAPLVGLADRIVDIVETGDTLRENGLAIRETIAEVSSVLVANRAAYKLRADEIAPIVAALREAVAKRA